MKSKFHPLYTSEIEPKSFTFPFNYTPHPLSVIAADGLKEYVQSQEYWKEEIEEGKMFGVLVVRDKHHNLGYLAAFSGLLGGRNDWDFFVPPVYDSMQQDGYFKTNERVISAMNNEIRSMENSEIFVSSAIRLKNAEKKAAEEVSAYKEIMAAAKQKRNEIRFSATTLSAETEAELIRESQYQKAELRRIKKRCEEDIETARLDYEKQQAAVMQKKAQRKKMSKNLQHWLFEQYNMLNARGESRNLCDIFATTPQRVPPSGAGDCCAPKLLQYAYQNNMHPICMAEFWWGRSPKNEIRHHFHYYPACRSKCKPILEFMLQGLNVDKNPHDVENTSSRLKIVYEDEWLIIVNKPSGMLSMPGRVNRKSVIDVLRCDMNRKGYLMPAHRLDMDTSGLLIVAKSEEILRNLHEQFASRQIKKCYSAVLEGELTNMPQHGFIHLPLLPDPNDSPRQTVDYKSGKQSTTEYKITGIEGGKTYVNLYPHTGRTHQLRVHCAHTDGLATPIVGDNLYGNPSASRLMLHAKQIAFRHPITNKWMQFTETLQQEQS